jgi:hypothetical protein
MSQTVIQRLAERIGKPSMRAVTHDEQGAGER